MTIAVHEEINKSFVGDVGDTWDVLQTTSPNTTDGVFQFTIHTNAMAADDVAEFRLKEKDISTGGTLRVVAGPFTRSGLQDEALTFRHVCVNDWDLEGRQRQGATGKAFRIVITKVT